MLRLGIACVVCVVALANPLLNKDLDGEWEIYKQHYAKSYRAEEEIQRLVAFTFMKTDWLMREHSRMSVGTDGLNCKPVTGSRVRSIAYITLIVLTKSVHKTKNCVQIPRDFQRTCATYVAYQYTTLTPPDIWSGPILTYTLVFKPVFPILVTFADFEFWITLIRVIFLCVVLQWHHIFVIYQIIVPVWIWNNVCYNIIYFIKTFGMGEPPSADRGTQPPGWQGSRDLLAWHEWIWRHGT